MLRLLLTLTFCVSPRLIYSQAVPTSSRASSIQLGIGWSFASPDFGHRKIQGLSIFGDYNLTRHWSVEGDIHLDRIITPTDISLDSYLIGPRYVLYLNRLQPYAKFLGGVGRFGTDYDRRPNGTYTYGVFAAGGGIDVRATRNLNIRAFDFEYQKWPGFRDGGLSPMVYTFGVAYRF